MLNERVIYEKQISICECLAKPETVSLENINIKHEFINHNEDCGGYQRRHLGKMIKLTDGKTETIRLISSKLN